MPACGQGRALFLYTKFCVQDRGAGKTTPCGLCAGIRPNRRQRRRSERRKARARPPCAHAGGQNPPSLPEPARQTTGATAARRRGRAHTARQAERARPEAGRQTAETAGMQGRAPRAQPTAPQARGTRARPPSPAKISARVRAAGEHDGGKGGAPLDGRGGGRGASPREMNSPALPHATAGAAAIGQASARRQAAGAPEGRKGHAPARHADARESAASGQADQTDDGEAASGRGSNCPPPRAPETARPRQRTAKRRRGGRRRRRPGGTRTQEQAAPSLPSAQSAPLSRRSSAADADGSDEHGAQNGGTAAGRGEPKGAAQTPLPRAQRGARPSGRATGQATGRKADGRDGAAGEFGRLCASVAVFSAGGG